MKRKIDKVGILLISSLICTLGISIKPAIDIRKQEAKSDAIQVLNINEEKKQESDNTAEKKKPVNTSWNLQSLYKSDNDFEKDLKSFSKEMKELKNYVGKVTKSKTHLSFALDIKEELDTKVNQLYAYVKLQKDVNKNSYKYLNMNDEMNKVYSSYSSICSDLELEILKLSNKEYKEIIKNNKIKSKYGMYLSNIRRSKDHYLKDEIEDVLNGASSLASLPSKIYELFKNMDKNTDITPSEYASILESGSREDRKSAYQKEFIEYNDNINTLAGLLKGQAQQNSFYANQRGYKSSLQMYLESDDISTKVYNNLISTVNKNKSSLHKYISLRKDVLNIDKVNYYDMSVPLVAPVEENISYDKAQSMLYSALSPLGENYGDILYKAFNERWIDVYSSDNKVSGGYCLSVYNTHPFVLVNYNHTLGAVSTLAHELGHAAYEYISSNKQNYFNSNPSIFTHEVASTTNEALLYEVLIKNASKKEEKAYYITKYLDLIKDTLFTQTMYAEFEKEVHSLVEEGKSVNALVLNDMWKELLTKYYGKDYEVDQLAMVGWSRIPHFYNSFYVYKYATGCSAGVSFAQDILKNGPENYLSFLEKGSSNYPIELLKSSGVNLNSTKPIEDTINKFDSLLKELETLIEK